MEVESGARFQALKTSPKFPRYFRVMTGVAEAYTYFILCKDNLSADALELFVQAAPDIMDITDGLNDVLSFYKESILSTERSGYVYHRALAEQRGVCEALRGLVADVKGYIDNVRCTLQGDPMLLRLVDAYVQGTICFHVTQPRYRLSELNIPGLSRK